MEKYPLKNPIVRDFVEKLRGYVFWLKAVRYTFKELYEDEEAGRLLDGTAKAFFDDLNRILQEYILLEFCKITDPATTSIRGKTIENFSVANLITNIDWTAEVADKLNKLAEEVNAFRGNIIEARNKLLAHKDKKAMLNKADGLGSFPEGEDGEFLSALEKIVNIAHEACFGSIAGDMEVTSKGDVYDLKKALKKALAFERSFSESTGPELSKSSRYLEEAGK